MSTLTAPRPTSRIRSLLEVAPDVRCVQLPIVNVYLIGEPGAGDRSWVLVDAGLRVSQGQIERAAAERFGRDSRPSAIILTHGHFDHVGALASLAEKWDVPVYAHELEIPYITGQRPYPPPDPLVGGGAMAWLSVLYPRGPFNAGSRVEALPDDGSVPELPDWRWIHTPGHTVGHVSFFRDVDRTLIVGDAFVTTKQESALAVMTRKQKVCRPPAYYTTDWHSARRSVEALALLRPHVAATGHGIPMYGDRMQNQLDALVRDWTRVIPQQGRYVHRGRIAGQRRVRRQSERNNRQLGLYAGIGLAAIAAAVAVRGSSRRTRARRLAGF